MLPLPPRITLAPCPPPTQRGPRSGATHLSPPQWHTRAHSATHLPSPVSPSCLQYRSVALLAIICHPQSPLNDLCPPRPTLLPSLSPVPPAGGHRAAAMPAQGPPGTDWAWSLCPCAPCRWRVPWDKDKPPTFPDRSQGEGVGAAVGTGTDALQQHFRGAQHRRWGRLKPRSIFPILPFQPRSTPGAAASAGRSRWRQGAACPLQCTPTDPPCSPSVKLLGSSGHLLIFHLELKRKDGPFDRSLKSAGD